MQTKQSEEPRALSLQEMEETNGGHSAKLEIGCGLTNMIAIACLMTGQFLSAAGLIVGAYMNDCYTPTY